MAIWSAVEASIRGFSNVLKLIQDPETTIEAADAAINEFFSDSAAYDKLVGGLARKDKVTFFFGEDGELTERAESIHAYESSTSPANFLRSIAGGDTDAFNKNFRSLRDIYAEVYKTVQQQQEIVGKQYTVDSETYEFCEKYDRDKVHLDSDGRTYSTAHHCEHPRGDEGHEERHAQVSLCSPVTTTAGHKGQAIRPAPFWIHLRKVKLKTKYDK